VARRTAYGDLCFPPFFSEFKFADVLLSFCLFFSDMNPIKMVKLSYLQAQASILRSSGYLHAKEITNLLNKSVCWVVNWSAQEEFEDRARTDGPAVLTK